LFEKKVRRVFWKYEATNIVLLFVFELKLENMSFVAGEGY
jgi:hypothetical protein